MPKKAIRKTIQFPDHDLHKKIMILAAEMSIPAPEVIRAGIELLKKAKAKREGVGSP